MGWRVANVTLKHERMLLGDSTQADAPAAQAAQRCWRETLVDGEPLIGKPVWRDRLMRLQGEVLAGEVPPDAAAERGGAATRTAGSACWW